MTSDARVVRSAVSYVLLFLLIFGLAGTVDHAEFRKQFKKLRRCQQIFWWITLWQR